MAPAGKLTPMKVLAGVALNLTWCALAVAQCVAVVDPKPSSRDVSLTVLTTLRANEEGRFSAPLDAGIYTVIVQRLGFEPALQAIEISWDGEKEELREVLQLRPTDTCDDLM